VNVTERYVTKAAPIPTQIGIRFFEGDERVVKTGELTTAHGMVLGKFETKAGTADMNDVTRLIVAPGLVCRLRFEIGGVAHETQPITVEEAGRNIHDIRAADLTPVPDFSDENAPLTKELAARAIGLTYETMMREQGDARKAELEARSITHAEHTMRWLEKSFGDAPPGKRSLWISMHGGGGAPAHVNDQQWQNQIRLYQPEEGIYVAPRAPTDTWNLWHQDHIDPLFARLIENMVAFRGVDPNRIYLMGYSAGGDGVWQLGPRMADRFAAASMMAGHPNESSLLGLRNLPFAIFMGADDAAFKRNTVAAEKSAELAALQKADPDGYTHLSRIYPGLGHWMERKDAEAVPWMAKHQRNPWPKKIVWFQDDVVHQRFYWLRLPDGAAAKEQKITAVIDGRTIRLDGDVPGGTRILLSDELLELDAPVEIRINGGEPIKATPVRTLATIRAELAKRLDPAATPTAAIVCP
jgi:predicted esterase